MKVFISWSLDRSKHIALALREWLPCVIQSVECWMSETDIAAGAKWFDEISDQLEDKDTRFGIICLTPENLQKPWLHFEAGALAKAMRERSFVCPYLYQLKPTEVTGPLANFNAVTADKAGTRKMLHSLNSAANELTPERLNAIFEKWWGDLEERLAQTPAAPDAPRPQRSPESMLEEILSVVRSLAQARPDLSTSIWRRRAAQWFLNLVCDGKLSPAGKNEVVLRALSPGKTMVSMLVNGNRVTEADFDAPVDAIYAILDNTIEGLNEEQRNLAKEIQLSRQD